MPKVQILIVSYEHDLPYLRHNLRSIKKFCSGFAGVTLVVPIQEVSIFDALPAEYDCELKTYNRAANKELWHLDAQCQKCFADKYCPDAEFILHTDSDCIFTEPVSPDDYFMNGKPVMVIKPWELCPGTPWKKVVDEVLKMDTKVSTMERHPQVNPRQIYPLLRTVIKGFHNMDFRQFVLSRKGTFPWGFTEHNIIGNLALTVRPQRYHWIKIPAEKAPPEKLRQFWSYSPVDKPQDSPHGEPPATPIDIINKILA